MDVHGRDLRYFVAVADLALAWRRDDNRPLVRGYVEACAQATASAR
ncbi:hypothetical protein ACFYO7_18355 [Nocardia salmonicida]